MDNKLEVLYTKLKPGQCYKCGKSPVVVIAMEQNVYVLNEDGMPVDYRPGSYYSAIGVCYNCGTVLGDYRQHQLSGFRLHRLPEIEGTISKEKLQNIFGEGSSTAKVVHC